MIPVSRTIGADRIVDEVIFRFTHTATIDWMLPGIAPTGRTVEVPLVAIVQFRDGQVAHEHIYWDQASVLVQIGLLDPRGLPVAGADTARKVLDPALPSNALLGDAWRSSEGSPFESGAQGVTFPAVSDNEAARWLQGSCVVVRPSVLLDQHCHAVRDTVAVHCAGNPRGFGCRCGRANT